MVECCNAVTKGDERGGPPASVSVVAVVLCEVEVAVVPVVGAGFSLCVHRNQYRLSATGSDFDLDGVLLSSETRRPCAPSAFALEPVKEWVRGGGASETHEGRSPSKSGSEEVRKGLGVSRGMGIGVLCQGTVFDGV